MRPLPPRTARAVVVSCLAAWAGAASAAPTWIQPAFDAGQTWVNPAETTLRPGNVAGLHRVASQQPGFNRAGGPTQVGGTLFLCSDRYGLGAIAETTGALRWTSVGIGGVCNSPLLDAGHVYTAAWKTVGFDFVDTLASSSQVDGTLEWQATGPTDPPDGPNWLTFNEPTLWKGGLYVSSGRSLVSAYRARDGQLLWRAQTGFLNNQVAVADGFVYTSTWAEGGGPPNVLFAHRAADGVLAWSQPTDASYSEYPATASGGRVFVASDSGYVRAFDGASGAALWSRQFSGYVAAPIVASPRAVIVNAGHSTLVAVDPATGATLWESTLKGSDGVASNLALGGSVLYAVTSDFGGTMSLAAFDARTGRQVLKLDDPLGGSYANVSVAGGHVFVTVGGSLVVYGL